MATSQGFVPTDLNSVGNRIPDIGWNDTVALEIGSHFVPVLRMSCVFFLTQISNLVKYTAPASSSCIKVGVDF
jgi:hypothetical protein